MSLQAALETIPHGKYALIFIESSQIMGNYAIIRAVYTKFSRQRPDLKRPDPIILEENYDPIMLQDWLWDPNKRRQDVCIIGKKHRCNGIETEIVIYVYPMDCHRCSKADADPVIISRSKAMLIMATYQRNDCNCGVSIKSTLYASPSKDGQIEIFEYTSCSSIESTSDSKIRGHLQRGATLEKIMDDNASYYGALRSALQKLPSEKFALVYIDNSQIMGKFQTIIEVAYRNLSRNCPDFKRPLPITLEGNLDSNTLQTLLQDSEETHQDICIVGNQHQPMNIETDIVVHIYPMDCQKCNHSDADPIVIMEAKETLIVSTFQRVSCHCGFDLKSKHTNLLKDVNVAWKVFIYLFTVLLLMPFAPIYVIALGSAHLTVYIAKKIDAICGHNLWAMLLLSLLTACVFGVLPLCLVYLVYYCIKKPIGKFCIIQLK